MRRVGARADSSTSASNVQRVGGDVGGLAPGEEQRGGAHLVHRAGAAEWRHRLGIRSSLLRSKQRRTPADAEGASCGKLRGPRPFPICGLKNS